jgi:shikimate kinase
VKAGNIFLVGLMGAGKTTVGRLLARRLKLRFFDTDVEAGFRLREQQVIAELSAMEGIVLATGGGAVLAADSRRHLAARGTVVYLNARPEDLYLRVRHDRNRPLLATGDPLTRLRQLHGERDALYRGVADLVVDTGAQRVQLLARGLIDQLEERWKASA